MIKLVKNGELAIVISNIALTIGALLLKNVTKQSGYCLLPLAASNFLASLMLIFVTKKGSKIPSTNRAIWSSILIWSVSYAAIYCTFAISKNTLSLPHLLIAESIAPLLASILSREIVGLRKILRAVKATFIPISLLLFVAFFEWRTQKIEIKIAQYFGLILLSVLFIASQTSARVIAKSGVPILWASTRVTFFSGIFITLGSLLFQRGTNIFSTSTIIYSIVIGFLISCTQVTFVYGIAKTTPVLSALLISSSVPTSLFINWILGSQKILTTSLVCALFYCLTILLSKKYRLIE